MPEETVLTWAPMKVLLEDLVPYDRSVRWRLHDAYFARCGAAAWTSGTIPYFGLNNPVFARQQARLIVGLVRELEATGALDPRDPVDLLEAGGGLGAFAANLLRALEPALGPRLRYVLSDYSEQTLVEAIRTPALAPLAEAGRVVPAILDLRSPERLTGLDGQSLDRPWTVLLANYVCCATPMKLLRKEQDLILEKHVRVELRLPQVFSRIGRSADRALRWLLSQPTRPELMERLELSAEWKPAEPFEAPHAEAIRALLGPFTHATLAYPQVFLDFLGGMQRRVRPGGLALVNDFGSALRSDLGGAEEILPEHYGNALAHELNFGLFDAWCAASGLDLVRTRNPLAPIHTAAIRYQAEVPRTFRKLFLETHVRRSDGEDMIDFTAAAGALAGQGQHLLAARLYRRCLRNEPSDPELYYRLGECCLLGGRPRLARRYLRRGARLEGAVEYDFAGLLEQIRRPRSS